MQVSSSVDRITSSAQVVATESAERALAVDNNSDEQSQHGSVDRGNQFQILSEWALSAELNRRVAMTEHTEQAIRRIYAQLENIRRELSQVSAAEVAPEQAASIAREIWQIDNTVTSHGSELTSQLRLNAGSQYSAKLSDQMDLLSPRQQAERLQVLMGRTSRAINLVIPPGQDANTTFGALESAFHRHGVSLSRSDTGQITFHVAQENSQLLREPWSFVGSGIRVAAGNPVTIELEQQQSEMRQMLESVRNNAEREHYIEQLESRQRRLRATLTELRNERNELLNQLQQLEMDTFDADTAVELATGINQQMLSGVKNRMPLIMAQSSVHVGLVRYGLG